MNVDLGTFNITTDKLFADLVKTRSEIDKLKLVQKDLQKEFSNSNKSVAENQKAYDKLNAELKGLTAGSNAYNVKIAERQLAEENLNKSLLEQTKINDTYQTQLTQNQLALNQLTSQARGYQSVLDAQGRATNENIDLYTRERAELSLLQKEQRELGAELIKLKQTGTKEEIAELTLKFNDASKKANDLAIELREIDGAGGNLTSNIGNYKSATEGFANSFDALKSGDIKGAFDGIKESVSGLFKTLLANPILGLVAGIVAGGKAIFDFNVGIKQSNQLLDNLGLDKSIRPQIDGLVKSFDVGFKDVANAVDQIMDLGLAKDQADALEQIKLGLVKAPDKEAFLSSLENNSQAAKNLGINLNEVIALQESFEATGSNAEATFGALEKAQLNLTKTNKDVSETLSKTLGSGFSQDILAKVQSGAITYTEALDKIYKKGEDLKISNQQQADLQVALFGKSAVSAGGYEQILKNISNAQDVQNGKLTETQKATLNLTNANQELEQAISNAFEIKGFASGWDSFKASATLTLANIINYLGELKKDLQPLIDLVGIYLVNSWESLKTTIGVVFDVISGTIKNLSIVIKGLVDFVKAVFSGDFKGAINVVSDTFIKLLTNVQNTFNKIRNTIIDGLKGILLNMKPILEAVGVDVEKLNKKLDGLKGKVIENKISTKTDGSTANETPKPVTEIKPVIDQKAIDDAKKKRDDAQKKLEDAQKKETESLQNLANEKVKLAQLELGIYIDKNKSILENEKFLTKALLEEEKKRLQNIQNNKLETLKEENDLQNKKLESQIKAVNIKDGINQTEKAQLETLRIQQKELELKYDNDVLNIKSDTQKQITAIDTRYSNERIEAEKTRKAIASQTELLELEARGASEAEIKTAQLDQQKEIEVIKLIETADAKIQAGVEKRLEEDELLTEEQALKAEIEAELLKVKDENEKIRLENQLAQLNNLEANYAKKQVELKDITERQKVDLIQSGLSQAKGLFKENTLAYKALAIGEATINTYKAASLALSTYAYPVGGIFAGIAIAQGLASVAKIAGVGFADGGYTGNGSKYQPAGIVHAGEVVFSQADVKALGGAMVVDAMRPTAKGYANGGIVGNVANLSTIQNQISNSGINTELLASVIGESVLAGAMAGTESGANRGIGNYNDNVEVRNNANF